MLYDSEMLQMSADGNTPVAGSLDSVLELLDEVESQVEALRAKAATLAAEQEQLRATLKAISEQPKELNFSEADSEDVSAHVARLRRRLDGASVSVSTLRDVSQMEAMERASSLVNKLVSALESGEERAEDVLRSYLNACRQHEAQAAVASVAAVDQKFERVVLACATDDQKAIRSRLEAIEACQEALLADDVQDQQQAETHHLDVMEQQADAQHGAVQEDQAEAHRMEIQDHHADAHHVDVHEPE